MDAFSSNLDSTGLNWITRSATLRRKIPLMWPVVGMNYLAANHEESESWLYRLYRSKLRGNIKEIKQLTEGPTGHHGAHIMEEMQTAIIKNSSGRSVRL